MPGELGPDLRPSGFDVGEAIGGVVELVGPDGVGGVGGVGFGLVVIVGGVVVGD